MFYAPLITLKNTILIWYVKNIIKLYKVWGVWEVKPVIEDMRY
jgi:hypothetical protein